jgi:anti-sigma B factor antagonist
MKITSTTEGGKTTLALEGWLDTTTAPELGAALESLDRSCTDLEIDMSGVEYISSAGLRQIVSAYKLMRGKLTLSNVSAEVMHVFKMAGFDKRLNII